MGYSDKKMAQFIETLFGIKFDNKYLIKDEEGKGCVEVCKAWEDNYKSGVSAGIEEGREQTLLLIVHKKICKNMTLDMIADDLEEDIEVIRPIYEKAKKQMS